MNKLPLRLPRTHLLFLMKELASVKEKIQEAKGLGSAVNPKLKRKRKMLREARDAMKGCNGCSKEEMITYTPKGPLPTL